MISRAADCPSPAARMAVDPPRAASPPVASSGASPAAPAVAPSGSLSASPWSAAAPPPAAEPASAPPGPPPGASPPEKNTPAHYPKWIPRVELPSERGQPVQYALVNDVQTLLYFVNQGTITFHVWFSRVSDLDRPDFVLYDRP